MTIFRDVINYFRLAYYYCEETAIVESSNFWIIFDKKKKTRCYDITIMLL